MMNWILGVVVAAVVVLGGGYLYMSGGYTMEEPTEVMVGEPTTESTEMNGVSKEVNKATPKLAESAAKFSGSWNDLAKRGGNYVCEVNHSSNVDISSGKVYVSGLTVRGDFTVSASGTMTESHMLKKGDVVYVWGGGMPQGIMMQATEMEGQSASTGTKSETVDVNQAYDWNCSATGASPAMFELPSDVEFMDLSAMMQGMMPR